MRASPLLSAALPVALALAGAAGAHKQPAPGGKVTVAVPAELVEPLLEAHTHAPLIEAAPDEGRRARLAHPPLPSAPGFRSNFLADVRAEDQGRVWHLVPKPGRARLITASLQRCLVTDDVARGPWPAAVLRAAALRAVVRRTQRDVRIAFDRPVGPLPELLSGCLARADGAGPTGAYAEVGPAVLAGRKGNPEGPPLLSIVELRPLGGAADLIAGSPLPAAARVQFALVPDVVLLLQSPRARADDPFGLERTGGEAAFQGGLGAELLLAVYGSGQGRPAEGVLPPGIAPARPLAKRTAEPSPSPLALLPLPVTAPRLALRVPAADPLLDGVSDRLAVLLRARGIRIDPTSAADQSLEDGIELLRWRPETQDPALALLALAGRRPALLASLPRTAFVDRRLLSEKVAERLEGALALERAFIETRVAVPLMTAERWFAVDPQLRGVQIRADGIPLLDDAYWWEGR